MSITTLSLLFALVLPALSQPQHTITTDQSRPLLVLARALVERYGDLITYEEAPADSVSEVRTERRPDGTEQRLLLWKPVTFKMSNADFRGTLLSVTDRGTDRSNSQVTTGAHHLLLPSVEDLLIQYHASGNPGKFAAINDNEYIHIVPAGRVQAGQLANFEPILSTVVSVNQGEGLCNDVLNGLIAELRQIRGVTIVGSALPFKELIQRQCSVRGHDLPAREVLKQLLEQVGSDPRTGLPDNRFVWSLTHDPTSDAYFLSTRIAIDPAGSGHDGPSGQQPPLPKPPGGPTQTNPFSKPVKR